MNNNVRRVGNFTNSEIFNLMTNGKGIHGLGAPAVRYINEKELERKLGRGLSLEVHTRPMAWGNFMEARVFSMLGFDYLLCSKETILHPIIKTWAGSTDFRIPRVAIAELKCYEPKNFAQYTDILLAKDLGQFKADFPQEYWQIVGNAILNQVPEGEAITYLPYRSELEAIREAAENYDGADQWKYRYIAEADEDALPWLPDECTTYKNLNFFRFTVPAEDKNALTERVLLAEKILSSRMAPGAPWDASPATEPVPAEIILKKINE